MRKLVCFMICFTFLTGCTSQEAVVKNKDLEVYKKIKSEIINQESFDKDYPYDIRLVYNYLDNKYYYDIIIDNVSKDMFYVKAVAYGNENTKQICPNIGIFDQEVYHLKKDYIDKENHFYKGIQLSGTIKNRQAIKVYIGYYTDEKKTEYIENYIEVKDEIR